MKKKFKAKYVLFLAIVIFIFLIIWVFFKYMEAEKPVIAIKPDITFLSSSQALDISAKDIKSGLKSISIELIQDDKSKVLYSKRLKGSLFNYNKNKKKYSIEFMLEPLKLDFYNGDAKLIIIARDYSWRSWFKGNSAKISKDITIDAEPPVVEVLTSNHYISPGGSALVIYKLNEKTKKSGVIIDNKFFPGYSGYFKNNNIYLCFFALDYNKHKVDQLYVQAVDLAGNISKKGFDCYIKSKHFDHEVLDITDSFLSRKLPEFEKYVDFDPKETKIEKYLEINNRLRSKSYKELFTLSGKSENKMYWSGAFLRNKGATTANFADQRSYRYKGKIIDKEVHMGVDIASFKHAPVKAANNGKVVLTKAIGIFGDTVVIDHGFGLFSMYSHLSKISVKNNQIVSKGDIIGNTGMTGLAGGDHLHYGMFINKTFINPIEWWDENWISNNIITKLKNVEESIKFR
ncbi:MAG: M23 family metallopeptidase [Deferribacterota bacterium]|nr:M23 family metallopeptidase [Deferribacterota bacterium]